MSTSPAPAQPAASRATAARRAALIGLSITIVGTVSYFFLMDHAWIRRTALPNAVGAIVGMLISIIAVARARTRWTIPTGLVSVALGGFFLFAMFVMARLPEATQAPVVGDRIADFTLPNQEGRPVSLASLHANGPALLVIYRGHW